MVSCFRGLMMQKCDREFWWAAALLRNHTKESDFSCWNNLFGLRERCRLGFELNSIPAHSLGFIFVKQPSKCASTFFMIALRWLAFRLQIIGTIRGYLRNSNKVNTRGSKAHIIAPIYYDQCQEDALNHFNENEKKIVQCNSAATGKGESSL